eukprot:5185088-Amphidinium_carterae.1
MPSTDGMSTDACGIGRLHRNFCRTRDEVGVCNTACRCGRMGVAELHYEQWRCGRQGDGSSHSRSQFRSFSGQRHSGRPPSSISGCTSEARGCQLRATTATEAAWRWAER